MRQYKPRTVVAAAATVGCVALGGVMLYVASAIQTEPLDDVAPADQEVPLELAPSDTSDEDHDDADQNAGSLDDAAGESTGDSEAADDVQDEPQRGPDGPIPETEGKWEASEGVITAEDQADLVAVAEGAGLEVDDLAATDFATETGETTWLDGRLVDPGTGATIAFTLNATAQEIPDDIPGLDTYESIAVDGGEGFYREVDANVHLILEPEGPGQVSIRLNPPGPGEPWSPDLRDTVVGEIAPGLLATLN